MPQFFHPRSGPIVVISSQDCCEFKAESYCIQNLAHTKPLTAAADDQVTSQPPVVHTATTVVRMNDVKLFLTFEADDFYFLNLFLQY